MNAKVKVLYVTNNQKSLELYEWLAEREEVVLFCEPLTIDYVEKVNPDWIVSYNYVHLINKDVIDYMPNKIINMHISLLPWNRGFSPNIWSFIDDTPKGVTIHRVNCGLDKGEILYQRECNFDVRQETFSSTYMRLNEMIVQLFKENWENIKRGNCQGVPQVGEGSYHSKRDLELLQQRIMFSWEDNIEKFLLKYKNL